MATRLVTRVLLNYGEDLPDTTMAFLDEWP